MHLIQISKTDIYSGQMFEKQRVNAKTYMSIKKFCCKKSLMIGGNSILKSYVNITIGQYIMLHIVKANGKTNRNFRSHPASSKSSCSIVCAPLEVSFLSVFFATWSYWLIEHGLGIPDIDFTSFPKLGLLKKQGGVSH